MSEKLVAFLKSRDRDTYLAVREDVISSPKYAPYSLELHYAEEHLNAGRYSEARESITGSMPNLLLSPRAYLLLSRIAKEELNDEETAKGAIAMAAVCLQGIFTTGDGSHEKPYLVVRVDDEYDVMSYLQKNYTEQRLINEAGRHYDYLLLEDGAELWFDVTDAFRKGRMAVNGQCRVRLLEVGSNRLKILALLREIWGLSPAQAKLLIESQRPILGTIKSSDRGDVEAKFAAIGAAIEFEESENAATAS